MSRRQSSPLRPFFLAATLAASTNLYAAELPPWTTLKATPSTEHLELTVPLPYPVIAGRFTTLSRAARDIVRAEKIRERDPDTFWDFIGAIVKRGLVAAFAVGVPCCLSAKRKVGDSANGWIAGTCLVCSLIAPGLGLISGIAATLFVLGHEQKPPSL